MREQHLLSRKVRVRHHIHGPASMALETSQLRLWVVECRLLVFLHVWVFRIPLASRPCRMLLGQRQVRAQPGPAVQIWCSYNSKFRKIQNSVCAVQIPNSVWCEAFAPQNPASSLSSSAGHRAFSARAPASSLRRSEADACRASASPCRRTISARRRRTCKMEAHDFFIIITSNNFCNLKPTSEISGNWGQDLARSLQISLNFYMLNIN